MLAALALGAWAGIAEFRSFPTPHGDAAAVLLGELIIAVAVGVVVAFVVAWVALSSME